MDVLRTSIQEGFDAVIAYLQKTKDKFTPPSMKCISYHDGVHVIEASFFKPGADVSQICNGLAVKQELKPDFTSIFYVSRKPVLQNGVSVTSEATTFSDDGFKMKEKDNVTHYVAEHSDHVIFTDEVITNAINFWLLEHRVVGIHQKEGYAIVEHREDKILAIAKLIAHMPSVASTYFVADAITESHPLLDDYKEKNAA